MTFTGPGGLPRKGQWVKLVRAITFGKESEPKGTVGIFLRPALQRSEDKDGNPCEVVIPGQAELHLVDKDDGTTRKIVAVKFEDIEPVIDRKDVPAKRLATYDKGWKPVA